MTVMAEAVQRPRLLRVQPHGKFQRKVISAREAVKYCKRGYRYHTVALPNATLVYSSRSVKLSALIIASTTG